MYNLGDDSELDGMSREAAGRYNSPGSPNWQALSEELDRVMPQEKKKRRFIFWWILPGLLTGGAATYTIIKQKDRTAIAAKNTKPAEPAIIKEQGSTMNLSEKDAQAMVVPAQPAGAGINKTTEQASTSFSANSPTKKNDAHISSFALQQDITHHPENKLSLAPQAALENIAVTDQPGIQSVNEPMQNKVPAGTTGGQTENKKESAGTKENKALTEQTSNITDPEKTMTAPSIADTAAKEETSVPATKAKNKSAISMPLRGKGWSFSLLTGVDESTVKFKYGYKPGVNIGLIAGYHLNETWAIKTGLIYTQKNYKMAGSDFTAPKGTWVSYYKLDEVEGYCRMWELPLMASYTLKNSGKKSVTLNAGLSSYFMTAESYDYYYYYNGNPTSRNANYQSTDTHILSIAHLSAGFENRISKNLSLQVEPYAKIPLGGVGFGSIKLSSFGVNFSVQWRQPAKK